MTNLRPRILVVDDLSGNIGFLAGVLGAGYEILAALSGEDAIQTALAEAPELILLDVMMPGLDGFEVCRRLKADPQTADIPIIFVTALEEAADEAQGLALGAIDFISKPFSPPVVQARVRNHLELKRQRDILADLSLLDGLTGLANRRRFDQFLDTEWRRGIRNGSPLSLIMIDIDHFKRFNDASGHLAGDGCLQRVAQCVTDAVQRPSDLVARYGGEEFVCVLPDSGAEGARQVAERVQAALARASLPHPQSPVSPWVTVSMGVATVVPSLQADPATLVLAADQSLYAAKEAGRNRIMMGTLMASSGLPQGSAPLPSIGSPLPCPERPDPVWDVLIIEDSPTDLMFLGDLVRNAGHSVKQALGGEQGLRLLAEGMPELILLDIRMEGLDGFEVCRRLKQDPRTREVPILFLTALKDAEDRVKGLRAGGVDYITKPYVPEEVLARIQVHLALRRSHVRLEEIVLERTEALEETRRKLQVELEAVRESEELLSLFICRSPIFASIKQVTPAGSRVLYASENCQELFGLPRSQAIGRSIAAMLPEETAKGMTADDGMVAASGQVLEREEEINGRWYVTVKFPIIQRNKTLVAEYNIDITERRQAERERLRLQSHLLQVQQVESLGILAGGIAHDMNNVLAAILAAASANTWVLPADSMALRAFEIIARAAVRGGKMVNALLKFARHHSPEEREVDFNAILLELADLLQPTTLAKVHLSLDLAPDLHPIRGDFSALTHVIMNLCVNSVDAMAEGGTLTLRTRNTDRDQIQVQVEDTGTGMAKDVQAKATEAFFTTKPVGKGTGLGLAMASSTVRAHHGEMEIQSEPGQGTQVTLRFPTCATEARTLEPPDETEAPVSAEALHVLLVDDDELALISMQMMLEALGHEVNVAQSGEAALGMLEAGLEPDLLILDMNMPGLGGAGTLPQLRVLRPAVPVLLATGRPDETALALASAHAGVTLFPKPFGMRELQNYIEASGLGGQDR